MAFALSICLRATLSYPLFLNQSYNCAGVLFILVFFFVSVFLLNSLFDWLPLLLPSSEYCSAVVVVIDYLTRGEYRRYSPFRYLDGEGSIGRGKSICKVKWLKSTPFVTSLSIRIGSNLCDATSACLQVFLKGLSVNLGSMAADKLMAIGLHSLRPYQTSNYF